MPRKKAFHPDAALDRAMDLFWRKGFEGASLSALLAAMEISRQSLYNTFGNKHELYLLVLDRYGQMQALQRLGLEQDDAGLGTVRSYFDRLISGMDAQPEYGACLMAAAAVERGLQDWAVQSRVEAHNTQLASAFLNALRQAASRGALRGGLDLALQADQLVAFSRGLGVMARSGMPLERLRLLVGASLGLLAAAPQKT
jgi:TetR/AcrR family transcriptional repressor of nem operon